MDNNYTWFPFLLRETLKCFKWDDVICCKWMIKINRDVYVFFSSWMNCVTSCLQWKPRWPPWRQWIYHFNGPRLRQQRSLSSFSYVCCRVIYIYIWFNCCLYLEQFASTCHVHTSISVFWVRLKAFFFTRSFPWLLPQLLQCLHSDSIFGHLNLSFTDLPLCKSWNCC